MKKLLTSLLLIASMCATAQTSINVLNEFKKYHSFVINWNETGGSTYHIKITHKQGLNTIIDVDQNLGTQNYFIAEGLPLDNKKYTVELERYSGGSLVETKEKEVTTRKIVGNGNGEDLYSGVPNLVLTDITDNDISFEFDDTVIPPFTNLQSSVVQFVLTSVDYSTEYRREQRIPGIVQNNVFEEYGFIKLDELGLDPKGTYRLTAYLVSVADVGVLSENLKTFYSDIGSEVFTLDDAEIPVDLGAHNITYSSATITWDFSIQGTPDYVDDMKIERTSNPFTFPANWSASGFDLEYLSGTFQSAKVSNLDPGSTHYFRVKTGYGNGEFSDDASDYVQFTTLSLPQFDINYPTPAGDRITDRIDFELTWPSDLTIDVESLEVNVDLESDGNPTGSVWSTNEVQLVDQSVTGTILGLTGGTDYQINVTATFNNGDSFEVLNSTFSTPAINPSFTIGTTTDITDRSFRVNLEDVHPEVLSFHIDVYEGSSVGGTQVVDLDFFSPSYKVDGLSSTQTYTYEVSAEYPDGSVVTASSTPTISTNAPLPDPATITHPVMGPVSGTAPSSIELNWIGNETDLDYFDLDAWADFGAGCTDSQIESGLQEIGIGGFAGTNTNFLQDSQFDLDVLSYQYKVRSYNSTGQYSSSEPINLACCSCYDSMDDINNEFLANSEIYKIQNGGIASFYLSGIGANDIERNYYYEWEIPSEWDFVSYENYLVRVDNSATPSTNFIKVHVLNPCTGEESNTLVYSIDGSENALSFDDIPPLNADAGTYELQASATSGLPVTFTSSDPSVASVSGSTLTVESTGTTTITAEQSGNATFPPATDISQTIVIGKGDQTISVDPVPEKSFDDQPFDISYTGGGSSQPVLFESLDESVATVTNSTITIVGTGEAIFRASQDGDTDYEAAEDVEFSFTVGESRSEYNFSLNRYGITQI